MELKNQRFGIEIEFTGIPRELAANAVAEVLESESSRPDRTCYHTRTIKDYKGRKWKVMRDSSVNVKIVIPGYNWDEYKCELVSPICTYEDIEVIQAIIRNLRELGACVAGNAGIHIHVDGANHTPASLVQLLKFMTFREELVDEALNNEARRNWCKLTNKDMVADLKSRSALTKDDLESVWYSNKNDGYWGGIDHSHYNTTRYHGLNLHAFFTKGTVEFRLFNSTMHAGKVKAYIQFCLALSAWSINNQNAKINFRPMTGYTAEKKVTLMRNVLKNRLGLEGDEFKTCRTHMLKVLKKNAADARQLAQAA